MDDFGQQIGAQTFSVGELRFGPRISQALKRPDGTVLRLLVGVTGVSNFAVENGAGTTTSTLGADHLSR